MGVGGGGGGQAVSDRSLDTSESYLVSSGRLGAVSWVRVANVDRGNGETRRDTVAPRLCVSVANERRTLRPPAARMYVRETCAS